MTSNFIDLLVKDSSSSQQFIAAVENIKSYSQWITSFSNTGNSSVDKVLSTAKTNDAQWYNTIFPTYLNMPATVLSKSSTIDSDLNMLLTLNSQLDGSDDKKVLSSIGQYATNLLTVLTDLQNITSGLGKNLIQYQNNLAQDSQSIAQAYQTIEGEINTENGSIASDQSKLNALEHASSKDKKKIKDAKDLIRSEQQKLATLQSQAKLMYKGKALIDQAVQSSTFLGNYWRTIAGNLIGSMALLKTISTQPADVMKADLDQSKSTWEQIKEEYQEIDQTIK